MPREPRFAVKAGATRPRIHLALLTLISELKPVSLHTVSIWLTRCQPHPTSIDFVGVVTLRVVSFSL